LPVPVRRLVINDVGPTIEWQALRRIGDYLGQPVQFASLQQAADVLWTLSTTFGPHTPAQWLELSRHMVKPVAGTPGALTLHYDPAIALPFRAVTPESAAQSEAMLWQLYDQITAQTLLVRGAETDLLSVATAQAMTQRGPQARLVEFAGVGHAPTFVADDQVQTLASFLLE
jgi:pimeloyl-ACP methyl ester carboxylesterase